MHELAEPELLAESIRARSLNNPAPEQSVPTTTPRPPAPESRYQTPALHGPSDVSSHLPVSWHTATGGETVLIIRKRDLDEAEQSAAEAAAAKVRSPSQVPTSPNSIRYIVEDTIRRFMPMIHPMLSGLHQQPAHVNTQPAPPLSNSNSSALSDPLLKHFGPLITGQAQHDAAYGMANTFANSADMRMPSASTGECGHYSGAAKRELKFDSEVCFFLPLSYI